MLVDDVEIKLEAGHGGKGAVAFNKVRLSRGPTGADGGNGGSVYFEGTTDIGALAPYTSRRLIKAEDGQNGRGQFIDGHGGEDVILKVPTGTKLTNLDTGFTREISHAGERFLAAGGGVGGKGNFKFRSSVNTSPMESQDGLPGDSARYRLELHLIADIGLVGLPNAGKSSLLNELTAARSKVGSYAFTTLEPHLGAYYGLIIADIPGLIEGASLGKGLGVKFLKHIERTKVLFHLISAESDDPARDYQVIRNELASYNPALAEKPEHIFLTKTDAVSAEEREEKLASLRKLGLSPVPVSILEESGIAGVKAVLDVMMRQKTE